MKTFQLKIVTPDGSFFDGPAVMLTLRGIEGDLAVLAGHVPFVTTVQPGRCKVETEDGSVKEGRLEGGLLSVAKEGVQLLSGSFHWA